MLEVDLNLEDMRKKLQKKHADLDIKTGRFSDLVIFKKGGTTMDWLIVITSDELRFRSFIISEDLVLLANSFRKQIGNVLMWEETQL